jgi:hypothetical protein
MQSIEFKLLAKKIRRQVKESKEYSEACKENYGL